MVFAAGLGTRLRPLTDERPKPGVPVRNRALGSYSIAHLAAHGVTRIALNTHHLGEKLPAILERETPASATLSFIHEPELLGTGGGLRNAWPHLRVADEDLVLVMNGDVIAEPDLVGAIELHRKLNAVATMVLRADPNAKGYGAIETDKTGRVKRLLGKPAEAVGPFDEWMFTGVHVLSARAYRDLPETGCIIRNSYRKWIDSGEVVGGFVDTSAWRDLGTLREYLDGNVAGLRENVIAESASVHPSAVLKQSVVGNYAHVGEGVTLERVVVWDGARVDASLSDAVVTPTQVVRVPA